MTDSSKLAPAVALILITAVWGSTFFMIKDLVTVIPPVDFLGTRFAIAALAILVFQFGRLRRAPAQLWFQGAVLGGIYSIGQLLQTTGLQYTDASVSGFVTGMYVVFTPILMALVFGHRPGAWAWGAVALATAGLAVLSLQGLAFGHGELLTLASALAYAIHIVLLGRWAARSGQPVTLGLIQVLFVGIFLGAAAVPGGIVLPSSGGQWASLLYMALVAGLAAIVIQTWAQSRIEPTTAAIIMTTEPIFAATFAVILGGESLTPRLVLGGLMIVCAMALVELRGGGSADAPAIAPRPQPALRGNDT